MRVPRPARKKRRKKRRPKGLEKWYCPYCQQRGIEKGFFQDTLAAKRKILDHLCKEYVYKRDKGQCQVTGKTEGLAAHHIFGKKAYPGGRWLVNNLILLSPGAHRWAHDKPEEFRRFIILWFESRYSRGVLFYDDLFQLVQHIQQFRVCDFDGIKAELEKIIEAYS